MKKLSFLAILFLGIVQACPVSAANIVFSGFKPSTPIEEYAFGSGSNYDNSTPLVLRARASSRTGLLSNRAIIQIRQLISFTVVPDKPKEKNGQTVKAIFTGGLFGVLDGNAQGAFGTSEGSYFASVAAKVNAGFDSWSSPPPSQIQGRLTEPPVEVRQPFKLQGMVQIGKTYNLDMVLFVNSSVTGKSDSNVNAGADFFNETKDGKRGLYITNVTAVPEPLTLLGTGTALGFGTFFKRELSKKQKKEKTKAQA